MSQTNECNVTYELVKPEELNPKERAQQIYKEYHAIIETPSNLLRKQRSKQSAIARVQMILTLPLIGTGRMQPESFEDLKYWKEVLNELEKM